MYERCLIAVCLGCNVLKEGVPGFGPSKMRSVLSKLTSTQPMKESLLEWLESHGHMKKLDFLTFVLAIYYEPAQTVCDPRPAYAWEIPHTLPEYLKEFLPPDGCVGAGPATKTCKGRGDNPHLYCAVEGSVSCQFCNSEICKRCACEIDVPNGDEMQT